MNILLVFPGFIIAFIIVFCYEHKIRRMRNKVHFYVTCEKNYHGDIIRTLWLDKPYYRKDKGFVPRGGCCILAVNGLLALYNLNYSDFEDMKNGEIREVYLDLKD